MAFSNTYTLAFAGVICVVCSLALAGVSKSLRPLQQLNEERDFQSKVLRAVGLPEAGADGQVAPISGQQVTDLFTQRIEELVVESKTGKIVPDKTREDVDAAREKIKGTDEAPALLSVYRLKEGQTVTKIALEMHGKGLWGPISGFVALDPSGRKIQGATFNAPKETPGLGAEIVNAPFQDQWNGKSLVNPSGKPAPVKVVKGKAESICQGHVDGCVDGISGATITSNGVTAMLKSYVTYYTPYLEQLGQGG